MSAYDEQDRLRLHRRSASDPRQSAMDDFLQAGHTFDADDAQSRQWSFDRNDAPQIIGGEHDGQELREAPLEWDAGGGFASLVDQASDGQLLAFLDLLRDAIQYRVTHYRRH